MKPVAFPYAEAMAEKGFWQASRFQILRRVSQLVFLALFLSGPFTGVWIAKGTLASSLTLGVLPLTDPFILLQSLAARHWPETTALLGSVVVLAAYTVLGGRTYCSWVCPINAVTDASGWLGTKFEIKANTKLWPKWRSAFLIAALAGSALTGTIVWELINPITAFHRTLLFGSLFGLYLALAIFLFDLFVVRDGWCGHLCPVGAFYGLVGKAALVRVAAPRRQACDDCMACYAVCPEPHVITPALKGERTGTGPVILSGDCTNCGACIDACPEKVFAFASRFNTTIAHITTGAPSSDGMKSAQQTPPGRAVP